LDGPHSWETTKLEDTPENRQFLNAQAIIISREIKHGTFDYLKHFPNGNKAHLFRRDAPKPTAPETVRSYYERWIERRPNQVRPQEVNASGHTSTPIFSPQRYPARSSATSS